MPTYVGLLRGVNVGGNNMVAMAELRELFESIGYANVRTFIQSGNVIFDSPRAPSHDVLEAAIESHFTLRISVAVRSSLELRKVLASNPFAGVDTSKLYVGFLTGAPSKDLVAQLDHERFAEEEFRVLGSEYFVLLPHGAARTKLPEYLNRQLKVPVTMRNWNTVNKLVELAKG
jgi:uncharacterized protein (DUF1697 family)